MPAKRVIDYNAILGDHKPNSGEGLTVDDLIEMLRALPVRARSNYVMVESLDVIGMSIAQSDQSQKWEFKIRLLIDAEDESK